jgi:ABC-type nitrate/sulfonate/bicarbonate transport system substrate-binding protein
MRSSSLSRSSLAYKWILTAVSMMPFYVPGLGRVNNSRHSAGNLNYFSIYVAEAKGFFRDEGLENETS